MKTTLDELVEDLDYRKQYLLDNSGTKVDKRRKAWRLYGLSSRNAFEVTYGHILTAVERKSTLVQLLTSVGGCINRRYRLRADEVEQVHLAWFLLISYFELGLLGYYSKHLKVKGKRSKYPTYQIKVLNLEALKGIVELVDEEVVDLFPLAEPPEDWSQNSFFHQQLGYPLIKHAHEKAVARFKEEDLSYLTETLNKLQRTPWRINTPVYETFVNCLNSEKTPFKFSKEVDMEKRASLVIEVEAVKTLAEKNLNKAFYHLYNVDFRGRIYPNTAFLHEQASDNAKGLLMFDQPVLLGEKGEYWLGVHTANMWGNDKVSLNDRYQWSKDSLDDMMLYVQDPLEYTGWMEADKPFCFLACCYEWSAISNWAGDGYAVKDFPSCLPVYVDGSNNGVQHLVAMSKDEEIAPLVNLTPSELPGDVYMFIAEAVMQNVRRDVEQLKVKDSSIERAFPEIHKELVRLRQEVNKCVPGSERYKLAIQRLKEFSNRTYDTKRQLGPIYWSKVTDRKLWRKTVKRPVMTLGYGGTQYGMVDMVHDDTYDLSEYLRDKDKAWSAYLGHLIYKTCYQELKGPAKMLRMFEQLAVQENEKDRPISFKQIVTNFPFVHSYRRGKKKEVELFYADSSLRVSIQLWQEATLNKDKQKTGAAPNIVHSIDAVHLSMYVHDTSYPVTVVHDSFGSHAGNMDKAFVDVRKKFVELYEKNPLEYILSQLEALSLIPQKGTLDVRNVLESDFSFA